MKIVVGLGNPGKAYAQTPHNAGFEALEQLAARLDCRLRRSWKFEARVGQTTRNGEPLLLLEPQTFMNCSGAAVAAAARYYRVAPAEVVVLSDDADLPLGRLRVRPRGSSGGHKGLQSIIQHLGSQDFARVRIGIGRDAGGEGLVDYVLTPLSGEARQRLAAVVDRAAQAVLCILDAGVEEAMNRFNADPPGAERAAGPREAAAQNGQDAERERGH